MQNWMNQFQESLGNLVDKLEGWLNGLIVLLPNIVLAALVMGIGLLLTRVVRKWVANGIGRVSQHKTVNKLLVNIVSAVFVLLVFFVVLSILQLDTALKSLLAGAGVAGLAIGLALQDPIINLFSGVMMATRKSFNIGDLVETNGFMGTVQQITLRSTMIRTFQGQDVIIPNKTIYQNPFKNYTSSGERRVDLACGVSYGDDLNKVKEVAIKAIKESVIVDQNKPVELYYTEFGASSINFTLRFWLDQCRQKDFLTAQSEAIMALKAAFDREDISIPFPIRTLDFGVKGGTKLTDLMPLQVKEPKVEGMN
ncbi:MAG: mechanosensitive ion channel family protein [Bacteroidetes bacterium]|nr:MAG: mechanosensitive ion channel family protein [Bacteroidota bacterium]